MDVKEASPCHPAESETSCETGGVQGIYSPKLPVLGRQTKARTAPNIPLFLHIAGSSCHCPLREAQLWAKQSFGHPSGEHDAKSKIMSSAKRPGVLIWAWQRVEKFMQPEAGRAEVAFASVCLPTAVRTSPSSSWGNLLQQTSPQRSSCPPATSVVAPEGNGQR